jgi:hypothetical protein
MQNKKKALTQFTIIIVAVVIAMLVILKLFLKDFYQTG